jgi:hypothetical protein
MTSFRFAGLRFSWVKPLADSTQRPLMKLRYVEVIALTKKPLSPAYGERGVGERIWLSLRNGHGA